MHAWQACLWGLLGAGLVESAEMWRLIRQEGRFPWIRRGKPQIGGYVIAVVLRFGMAGGVTVAYAAAHQIGGSLAAITVGITAPMIIQQLADRTEPSLAPRPPTPASPVDQRAVSPKSSHPISPVGDSLPSAVPQPSREQGDIDVR